ncbi:DUF4249 domain-containing protein [Mucilaginibacter sp. McL0603]|uniref:DUF4249 domain-containing protein n=1 Tax=Mucilaginibacter sp. McL0603 TaxID=3415670 RepID=UPI003CF3A54C
MSKYLCAISFSAMAITACKKPYAPSIAASNSNYLVVEGVINSGQDSTIINLSRTVNIADTMKANPELGAQVLVESDQNITYSIPEIGKGKYASPALNLDNTHKYHLYIKTSDGKEYASDPEAVKPTPPIDSVGFITQSNGIQLYVNTHDDNNATRYYRWEYTETWNFHAKYGTNYITDGTKLKVRTAEQQIFTCYGNQVSSTTLLGSSAKLAKDVIYQSPLTQVASTSEKLETKYSILVKQYALTSEAYNFWQNLKKNTEQLGTIFSTQPSEIPGNIRCITKPSEPVVGYISVTNVQQKRIFITNSQLPANWIAVYPYQCELDTLLYCHDRDCQNDVALFLLPLNTSEFAIYPIESQGKDVGYLSTDAQCADCTIRGSNKQPSFWK